MATFQQAVEKLTQVFQTMQGAWRGPARGNWAFSQFGGTEAGNTLRGRISQNFGFSQGLQSRIVSDAIKNSVATGADPMASLGASTDVAAKRMSVLAAGSHYDYFGGVDPKTSKLIRLGMQSKGEREAYKAGTSKQRMAEAMEAAEAGADIASPFSRLAYHGPGSDLKDEHGNPKLPVQLTQGAVQNIKDRHGYLTNLFSGISSPNKETNAGLERARDTLREMGKQIERIDLTGGKAWGDRIAGIQMDFEKIHKTASSTFSQFSSEEHKKFQSPAGTHWMAAAMGGQELTPSRWFRAGGLAGIYGKKAVAGLGKYFRGAGADLREGNIDWRAMHALTGFGFGALAAAGGPGMSTLSGSAQLAMGSFGRGLNGPAATASRILQGAGGWADRHPIARDALGWTVAAGGASLLGIGALSRLKTGARTIAGAVNNGLTYFTSLGAGASGAAKGLGNLGASTGAAGAGLTTVGGLAAAAPFAATVAGTAYLPIKAGWNLMEEESLSKRYAMSQTSTGGERLNPLESMAKFLFGPSTKDQIARQQESKDKNNRDLAISFGNLFQGGGAVPGDTDLRGYISSKANMSPLDLEQMMSEFRSMVDYLEKLSGSSEQTNNLLERMTVGNRPG